MRSESYASEGETITSGFINQAMKIDNLSTAMQNAPAFKLDASGEQTRSFRRCYLAAYGYAVPSNVLVRQ